MPNVALISGLLEYGYNHLSHRVEGSQAIVERRSIPIYLCGLLLVYMENEPRRGLLCLLPN